MGKAPLGAPGQPDYGMQMMKIMSMISDANYNKERAAYYGAEKEARIADTRAKTQEREEKAIGKEAESEFSGETGIPYDPKKDEATIAPFLAAKKAGAPVQQGPMRREESGLPGLIKGMFTPKPAAPPPGEDPDITQGRIMGTKAALVPNLYEQAQKQVQDVGYNDPKSTLYSPETVRAAGTRTMRPEDVDKFARDISISKEHVGKGRKELAEAQTKELGFTVAQENRRLAEIVTQTDPRDTKTINAAITRMALNNGHTADVMKWKKEQRDGYLEATKGANVAYEKLLKAQTDYKDKIDLHASLAAEASKGNRVAAELAEAPMTDLVVATPYNSWNPLSGKYTLSNRVKVPTDYARAEQDGIIPSMIRAPLDSKDGIWEQRAQIDKQGAYYAWEIIKNNPDYLGNPKAFEAAVDKDEAIPTHIKSAAKHHMGMYMQMNEDRRSDADKVDAAKKEKPEPLGPPSPPAWSINLPGGPDPVTGERIPGPEITSTGVKKAIKGILPTPPEGGMFGTGKSAEDYIKGEGPLGPERPSPGIEDVPSEVPLDLGTAPQAPKRLPGIKGVPPAGANIPPDTSKMPIAPPPNVKLGDPLLLTAIRETEMGGPGREMGVVSIPAPDFASQVKVSAVTVKNTEERYRKNIGKEPMENGRYTPEFLFYFSQGGPGYDGYAKIGAGNDPKNLNKNHFNNLIDRYNRAVGRFGGQ